MRRLAAGTKAFVQTVRETNWLEKALEPVTILTVAIVIVSSLQWHVMSQTDATMSDQVKVMLRQTSVMEAQIQEMKSEQRPWVYAETEIMDNFDFNSAGQR